MAILGAVKGQVATLQNICAPGMLAGSRDIHCHIPLMLCGSLRDDNKLYAAVWAEETTHLLVTSKQIYTLICLQPAL